MAFCRLKKKLEINMVKKLLDTATKTSKRVVHKTAEAKGDLIGNKVADKTTSVAKSKNREKKKR